MCNLQKSLQLVLFTVLSLNQMFDVKRRHPNTVFACSACAALFKSEEALKEHQEVCCNIFYLLSRSLLHYFSTPLVCNLKNVFL